MDVSKFSGHIESLRGADLLVRVARHQNSLDGLVSPDFELIDDGPDVARAWFDSDADAASQFIPFAQSADGGLFAYWKCEAAFAIIYLASECEGTRVIAQSVSELLSIIAFGSDRYVIDIEHTDQDEEWDGPEEASQSLDAFRVWLASTLAVSPAASPLAIIKQAMSASPDLMGWVRKWQEMRYGTEPG